MRKKILFYNFDNIIKNDNVSINFHELTFNKKIYQNESKYCIKKFKNLHTYYSYIKSDDENYLFFKIENLKNKMKIDKTYLTISKNNIFNNEIIPLGKFGCASHNMTFFYSKNNEILAFGGKCNTEGSYKKKKLPDYGEDYFINIGNKKIVNPKLSHPYRANGLYLYKFDKKENKLNLMYENPLVIYTDLFDKKYDGVASLDSHISCFYDMNINKYRLYCRANLYRGIRTIQTSTSEDLVNWKKFELLNFTPNFNKKNDNYYCISSMNYPDSEYYIGISPYFTKNSKYNKDGLYILFSKDGKNWVRCNKIIDFDRKYINAPLYGVIQKLINTNNKINFYIDFTKVINNSQYIGEYEIKIDRLTSISNLKNEIGYFEIQKLSDNILLNFKTNKDGYVNINDKKLEGDYINYKLDVKNSKNVIKILLKNSEIFSIIFI